MRRTRVSAAGQCPHATEDTPGDIVTRNRPLRREQVHFPFVSHWCQLRRGLQRKKRVDDAGLTTLALPKDHFSLRRPPVFFACPYCRLNIYSPLQDQNSLQVTLACLEASPLKMSQYGCIAFHRSISEKHLKFSLDRTHSRVFSLLRLTKRGSDCLFFYVRTSSMITRRRCPV